ALVKDGIDGVVTATTSLEVPPEECVGHDSARRPPPSTVRRAPLGAPSSDAIADVTTRVFRHTSPFYLGSARHGGRRRLKKKTGWIARARVQLVASLYCGRFIGCRRVTDVLRPSVGLRGARAMTNCLPAG